MSQQHRRLFMLNLFSGLVGGACATLLLNSMSVGAQATPDPVDSDKPVVAQEFQLIDSHGRVRARLSFSDQGQPFLQLSDENATSRVWMGISTDTGIALHDVDGKTRLVLSVDEQGEPELVARDRQHRTKSFRP